MESIVTRFPPSPSGFLHLGGARTAIFNWLYARHTKGRFVLRFEDTDRQRSTQQSVDAILDALEWLGIDWDEGPFFQSQRTEIYRQAIAALVDRGHAYYCTCSADRLEKMRQQALAEGRNPSYDGTCRDKQLKPSDAAVVRFAVPLTGKTVIADRVKGSIAIPNPDIGDFVICRSDGSATYNLAVAVDDMDMGINTIIRGDDHISNTPKQMLIYEALGKTVPTFAHVPMVLGSDRARLSKRHGATSVTAYREMGYLPEAMLNYLVRLGWSFGDQEFFTRRQLIESFSLENIGRSAGIFDGNKLMALNADHIQAANPQRLRDLLVPMLAERNCPVDKGPLLDKIIASLVARSKTMVEMADSAVFYFHDPDTYDPVAAKKNLKQAALAPLQQLIDELQPIENFSESELEAAFARVMTATGLKLGKIAQPVRVALTGRAASPGIFEIIEIIGKAPVLRRLQAAVEFIQRRYAEATD